MRKVVTGSQVAQLRNPDPFAVPAWRSPVYRTPFLIVAVVQAARLAWRLLRFVLRHPAAVACGIAAVLAWRLVGWPVLAAPDGEHRRNAGLVAVAVPGLVLPAGGCPGA